MPAPNRSQVQYENNEACVLVPGSLVQRDDLYWTLVGSQGAQGPAGPQGPQGAIGPPGRNATTVVYRNPTSGGLGVPVGTRNGQDGVLPTSYGTGRLADPWVRRNDAMAYRGDITKTVQQPAVTVAQEPPTYRAQEQRGRGVVLATGFKSKLVLKSL